MVQSLIILLAIITLSFYLGFREGSKFVWFKVNGLEKGKEEMLDKACKWLEEHSWEYLIGDNFKDEKMISDFRKAMEE